MVKIKYTKAQKIASFSLVFLPILSCYHLFGTALTKFIMLALVVYFLATKKEKINVPPKMKWFLIYAFTVPQIVAIVSGNTSHLIGSYLTLILFFATFLCFQPHIKLHLITRYYRIFAYVAIIVFILQEISAIAIGTRFGALIPFLNVYTGESAREVMLRLGSADRSCSIFSEPSHFAQYLAPYLALLLYENEKKGVFFSVDAIIVSLVFVFLRSGNGYFLLATIWMVYFLMSNISLLKKICIIIPMSGIFLFFAYRAFSNSDMGAGVLERAETLDPNYSGGSRSASVRIYRGFMVYETISPIAKALGVGLGGANDIIDNSPVNWMFRDDHYLNNASGFLISFGYIGTCILLFFLFSLCTRKKSGSVVAIAAFLCLGFMESFLFDSRMLLYVMLPYAMKFCDDYEMSRRISRKSRVKVWQYKVYINTLNRK